MATGFDKLAGSIIITVTDDGVGMNRNVVDRITDPFFTTRQDQGGTGLGLYISYSIIQAHNGDMTFSSNPGEGTVVIVKIPVADDQKGRNK